VLKASGNRLDEIPEAIGDMGCLVKLDVSTNNLARARRLASRLPPLLALGLLPFLAFWAACEFLGPRGCRVQLCLPAACCPANRAGG